MTETANSHRELIVWQKAMDFVVVIYRLTEKLPVSEQYNVNQIIPYICLTW